MDACGDGHAQKNLVISGSGTGIDIPAGQQLVFDVTVVLNDSATNVSGLAFPEHGLVYL